MFWNTGFLYHFELAVMKSHHNWLSYLQLIYRIHFVKTVMSYLLSFYIKSQSFSAKPVWKMFHYMKQEWNSPDLGILEPTDIGWTLVELVSNFRSFDEDIYVHTWMFQRPSFKCIIQCEEKCVGCFCIDNIVMNGLCNRAEGVISLCR